MSCALFQVDAFTDTSFAGNPAAVCVLPETRETTWMQQVAAEMNLSETAFLRPRPDGTYHLRWFTPTDEVDLCGHATLASAHVLWSEGFLAPGAEAQFHTTSGLLSASRDAPWITMNFPTDPPSSIDPPPPLLDGLHAPEPLYVGRSERDLLVHLGTEDAVQNLDPDLSALATLDARGVIVTAPADDENLDFVSRFFAPGVGVPEDPVTGSAHCALGPYWADQLDATALTARQVSPRGGTVRLQLEDPTADRIALSGQATTVLRGRLDS
jgi:predicted PhzF superfamily epimerase YddE/YHI9